MPDDTIVVRAPAGTKARWVRAAHPGKLADWIISQVEARPTDTAINVAALVALAGLRSPQTTEVVRLILIDGLPVGEAAQRSGISQPSASQALARVRRALDLARVVVG